MSERMPKDWDQSLSTRQRFILRRALERFVATERVKDLPARSDMADAEIMLKNVARTYTLGKRPE